MSTARDPREIMEKAAVESYRHWVAPLQEPLKWYPDRLIKAQLAALAAKGMAVCREQVGWMIAEGDDYCFVGMDYEDTYLGGCTPVFVPVSESTEGETDG